MRHDSTLTSRDLDYYAPPAPEPMLALVVVWSYDEPERVGEVLVPAPGVRSIAGRGDGRPQDPGPRLRPLRIRPGAVEAASSLATRRISRQQLALTSDGETLLVERLGRCPLYHQGQRVEQVRLRAGDLVELERSLLLLAVRRVVDLPTPREAFPDFAHGAADPFGMVGESAAAWALREEAAFLARRDGHVLVHGPSGSGKELVARMLHALSPRSAGAIVSRNAAAFPESLVDAELFGHRRDYPNVGMPEHPGLIGASDGGTLVLDEIGELPPHLQAHLLRVLDHGEYQRLGDVAVRRADLRLVALTNRDPGALKEDFAARLLHRIALPGLDARREDVPLLVRAILTEARAQDPALLDRFFDGPWPRLAPDLVAALVSWDYGTHVRELAQLLWRAVRESRGDYIQRPASLVVRTASQPAAPDPDALTAERIRAALDAHEGVVSRAWRDLGLRNRDQLRRLMRKHGIER